MNLEKAKQAGKIGGAIVLLLGAFFYVFVYAGLVLGSYLAPWDASGVDGMPEPGTRDFMLNEFFEVGPGSEIVFACLLVALILVIVYRVNKKREPFLALILNITAAQIMYLASVFGVMFILLLTRTGDFEIRYRPFELLIQFGLLVEYFYLVACLDFMPGAKKSSEA